MNIRRTLLALTAALGLVVSACSHVVTIDSEPPGATIYVNGQKQGTAPVQYTEKTGWNNTYRIEAKKRGYSKTERTVEQTEWNSTVLGVSSATAVIGFFLVGPLSLAALVGIAFAKQMPDQITVELEKRGSGGGSGTASGAGGIGTYTGDSEAEGSDAEGGDYDYGY